MDKITNNCDYCAKKLKGKRVGYDYLTRFCNFDCFDKENNRLYHLKKTNPVAHKQEVESKKNRLLAFQRRQGRIKWDKEVKYRPYPMDIKK